MKSAAERQSDARRRGRKHLALSSGVEVSGRMIDLLEKSGTLPPDWSGDKVVLAEAIAAYLKLHAGDDSKLENNPSQRDARINERRLR